MKKHQKKNMDDQASENNEDGVGVADGDDNNDDEDDDDDDDDSSESTMPTPDAHTDAIALMEDEFATESVKEETPMQETSVANSKEDNQPQMPSDDEETVTNVTPVQETNVTPAQEDKDDDSSVPIEEQPLEQQPQPTEQPEQPQFTVNSEDETVQQEERHSENYMLSSEASSYQQPTVSASKSSDRPTLVTTTLYNTFSTSRYPDNQAPPAYPSLPNSSSRDMSLTGQPYMFMPSRTEGFECTSQSQPFPTNPLLLAMFIPAHGYFHQSASRFSPLHMWNNNQGQHWGTQQHTASILYSGQRMVHNMPRISSGSLNASPQMHPLPQTVTSLPNHMAWPVGNYSMPRYQHGQENNNPSSSVPPELPLNVNQLFHHTD